MLERDIVAAIKKYLTSLGSDVFFWKEHGGPYGTSGIPDIICCYKGRFIGMECKLPGGRLTELQKRAISKINAAGGIAHRVESVEDAKAVMLRCNKFSSRAYTHIRALMCPLFLLFFGYSYRVFVFNVT